MYTLGNCTQFTTFQCVYTSSFVYCVHSQSPHSEQHMAVFLLSLHFKDNTVCVIEHISFNSVQTDLRLIATEVHGHSWWILLSDSARFALDRRTSANANTQCFIPGQIINNRAARSFRYTVLPVGSRPRLRSYRHITLKRHNILPLLLYHAFPSTDAC